MPTLFRAKFVASLPGVMVRDGGVLVEGERIAWVGPIKDCPAGEVETIDLGNALLLPGLVNAHTHLELSDARPGRRPETFGGWLIDVIRSRATLGDQIESATAEAARRGAAESLGFGVTCVGDISRFARATRPELAESPLRVVSFGEIQAMAGRRKLLEPRLTEATDLRWDGWADGNRLTVGVSPHAPYTVEPEGYRRCLEWAIEHNRPICTHLSETTEEALFLNEHGGPLRELWELLKDWDEQVPRFGGSPVRFAAEVGLLDAPVPTVLAHVNYVEAEDYALLARENVSVVYCPRTHAFFGHESHPVEALLAAGVNVCVGTDSRASSPDLNLVEELRLVRRERPHLPAEQVWSMATSRPARALGLGSKAGRLAKGCFADFVAFDVTGETPLDEVLDSDTRPAGVWVSGERVTIAANRDER